MQSVTLFKMRRWYSYKAVRFLNNIFLTIHQRCFQNHWRVMKIFPQSVYILCSKREKFVQLLLNIFFIFKQMCGCFWEYFVFLRNVQLLLKDIKKCGWLLLKKKNCAAAFEGYCLCLGKCVAAPENISCLFKERAAASDKILRKNVRLLLKENVQLFVRIMST